jgi:hypothetical protein
MPRLYLPALMALATIASLTTSPARADRCDDLAALLARNITDLKVGRTAANAITLSHPAARSLRLGCTSRNVTNELFASADGKKPLPAFYDVLASAAALVFTIPKKDTLNGATRCIKRIGLLRGHDIKTRYRRLDIHCTRTKATTTIAISRQRE